MQNNNDVVIINLDRPREIRFGHKAIKTLCSILGKSFEEISAIMDNSGPEVIEQVMYCGLLSDAKKNGETLTLEQMEDLLDCADPYVEVVEKMNKAVMLAFGQVDDGKNIQGTAKNPKK